MMLVIMETRCNPDKLKRTFNLLGYDGFLAMENSGFSGGIIVAWKVGCFVVNIITKKFQYLHLKVNYPRGRAWFFTAIYASPQEINRNVLWNDLKSIAMNMKEPWLLAGDFNDIMSINEKKGGVPASIRKCNIFKERIDVCRLIDVGFMGAKYTWQGPVFHGGQRIYERLDRALSNDLWRLEFPDGYVKVLPRLDFSDHHPLLICPFDGTHVSAPKQFRFESAWLMDASFHRMLETTWSNQNSVCKNLQDVRDNIDIWKFESFDQVRKEKKELVDRIGGIQKRVQAGNRSRGLIFLEAKLQHRLDIILKKEELMWYQRSRARWLKDGDRNTKYYQIKAVTRRRKNNILMLRGDNNEWVEDADKIRCMATEFYQKLFTRTQVLFEWNQTSVTYPRLSNELLEMLNAPITNDEVRKAIFVMNPWKAPGPDGFPAGFYQKSWSFVGEHVCDFVRLVWSNPSKISEVNQTDICLIPKIQSPEYISQFRPISLCNTIYKVVSKVVVERLKDCIPIIISPYQTGFVPGRNIHENIIVAQEMTHSMVKMKGRKGYVAIKVDLSKAYDKLNWDFIWQILKEVQLPESMINVIMHSVTSVETNVKWNGARGTYFRPQRGIR
jgi:hypothetical protein